MFKKSDLRTLGARGAFKTQAAAYRNAAKERRLGILALGQMGIPSGTKR